MKHLMCAPSFQTSTKILDRLDYNNTGTKYLLYDTDGTGVVVVIIVLEQDTSNGFTSVVAAVRF